MNQWRDGLHTTEHIHLCTWVNRRTHVHTDTHTHTHTHSKREKEKEREREREREGHRCVKHKNAKVLSPLTSEK